MTTTAYQQSDYKTNVDQTDRHLHVTSGDKTIKVSEQSDKQLMILTALDEILIEAKKTNMYLAEISGFEIKNREVL